ncbi:hypothetical protein GCM10009087_52000 [Sphingomonas oligophenolica]
MVIRNSKSELADLVGKALAMADELGFAEVGLRLDQALIALTGAGVAPPADYLEVRVTELS